MNRRMFAVLVVAVCTGLVVLGISRIPPALTVARPSAPGYPGFHTEYGGYTTLPLVPTPVSKPAHPLRTPPTIPAGSVVVGVNGVQLFVPSAWKLNDVRCGTPLGDTAYEGGGPTKACLVESPAQHLTTVEYLSLVQTSAGLQLPNQGQDAPDPAASAAAVQKRTVDGTAVQVQAYPAGAADDLDPSVVVSVPERQAAFVISSPDQGMLDALVATLHVVDVSPEGCAVQLPSSRFVPDDQRDRQAIAAGSPASAVVCLYKGGLLATATTVQDVPALLAAVRGGVPGVSHVPDSDLALDESCEADFLQGYLVRLTEPDGSVQVLGVRTAGCGDLAVSDGFRSTRMTVDLEMFFFQFGIDGQSYAQAYD